MWNNYFFQIQKKYNIRVSTKEPLVIRFDGKGITRNKDINFLDDYKGSFSNSLEECAKYFTEKYHGYSIFGSDEISFIFLDPMQVIKDLDPSDNSTYSNEIIAMFSQYFFNHFNSFNRHYKIFWHGKCFSIKLEKLNSYVKYRVGIIKNVMSTYFLKRKELKMGNHKLEEKIAKCKEFDDYYNLEKIINGNMYYDGKKIDLDEYLKSNKIVEIKNEEDEEAQNFSIDLIEF